MKFHALLRQKFAMVLIGSASHRTERPHFRLRAILRFAVVLLKAK